MESAYTKHQKKNTNTAIIILTLLLFSYQIEELWRLLWNKFLVWNLRDGNSKKFSMSFPPKRSNRWFNLPGFLAESTEAR